MRTELVSRLLKMSFFSICSHHSRNFQSIIIDGLAISRQKFSSISHRCVQIHQIDWKYEKRMDLKRALRDSSVRLKTQNRYPLECSITRWLKVNIGTQRAKCKWHAYRNGMWLRIRIQLQRIVCSSFSVCVFLFLNERLLVHFNRKSLAKFKRFHIHSSHSSNLN